METTYHPNINESCIFVENEFMISAVVLSYDNNLCSSLSHMIEAYSPNLNIISICSDIKTGVGLINEHEPDLLIIDTKLNDGSGFDLLRHFDKPDFKTIFISSSIDYAYTAIKFNAVDYIIVPIEEEELTLSINKAVELIRYDDNLKQKAFGQTIEEMTKSQKLVLKTSDQIHVINIENIIRIEADGNYSTFFMDDNRKILVSKPLKGYEEQLLNYGLHRIHKSHIFNSHKMSYFDRSEGGFVVMVDGSRVPVASRKKDLLLELFNEFD